MAKAPAKQTAKGTIKSGKSIPSVGNAAKSKTSSNAATQESDSNGITKAVCGRHTPPHSVKVVKRGTLVEVKVHLPKSAPPSVLDISADDSGFKLNTGIWGGGYVVDRAWPTQVEGHVKAGDDVEVQATFDRGVLTAIFEVEGVVESLAPDYAPPKKGKQNSPKQGAGKRGREENVSGESRKKQKQLLGREGSVEAEPSSATNTGTTEAQDKVGRSKKAESHVDAEKKKKSSVSSKKGGGGALLEDKGAQLALVDEIGGAKEGRAAEKLSREEARDRAQADLVQKREDRRAAKIGKKEALVQNLKKSIKESKKDKKKSALSAGGSDGDGVGVGNRAGTKPKKRISWGGDEIHPIPARANR